MIGNGELDQNAVNGRVSVQRRDQGQEVGLTGLGRQLVGHRMHAGGQGLLALAADIDLATGIVADEHDR